MAIEGSCAAGILLSAPSVATPFAATIKDELMKSDAGWPAALPKPRFPHAADTLVRSERLLPAMRKVGAGPEGSEPTHAGSIWPFAASASPCPPCIVKSAMITQCVLWAVLQFVSSRCRRPAESHR